MIGSAGKNKDYVSMTSLPPPPPTQPSFAGSFSAPPSGSLSFESSSNDDNVSASKLPIIVAASAILISAVLLLGLLPETVGTSIVGYLCTPIITTLCGFWDALSQRLKSKESAWYVKNWTYPNILRVLIAVGYLLAIWHSYNLAQEIGSRLANGH